MGAADGGQRGAVDAALRPRQDVPDRHRPAGPSREALLWVLTATLVAAAVVLWIWLAALAG